MIQQQYPLTETSQFLEFTSVALNDTFNSLFDIERMPKENLFTYCQNLINKIFQLRYSQIPNFLKHHCTIAKNPMQWLNNFERLISVNENLFQNCMSSKESVLFLRECF